MKFVQLFMFLSVLLINMNSKILYIKQKTKWIWQPPFRIKRNELRHSTEIALVLQFCNDSDAKL